MTILYILSINVPYGLLLIGLSPRYAHRFSARYGGGMIDGGPSVAAAAHSLPSPDNEHVPFYRPDIADADVAEVVETLRSGWLTSAGRVQQLEAGFRALTGATHALAVNSGTAALHLALEAAGVGPGDEVILPSLTFAACASVVVQLGARPVLAEVRAGDLTIDPVDVERRITARTKAVMVVHYAGQPCRMDELAALTRGRGLFLLEDAAHAAGARYHGRPVGTLGDAAAFSFYATKNLTTGEGGMLTTSRPEIAERARVMTLHGLNRDAWKRYEAGGSWFYEVVAAGYKYNLSDILAALGVSQLERLHAMNTRRRELALMLRRMLADCPAVELPDLHTDVEHVWQLFVVKLRLDTLTIDRARFIQELAARGIGASVHFIPIHYHPFYRDAAKFGFRQGDYPVTEAVYERLVSLPLFPAMTDAEAARVAEAVWEVGKQFAR